MPTTAPAPTPIPKPEPPYPGTPAWRDARRHLLQSIGLGAALLAAVVIGYGIALTQGHTPGLGDAALPLLLIWYLCWAAHQVRTIDHFPTTVHPPQHRTP